MAKTKYIVPAVAMLLCAVSLIGAGYAAYSATLTDSETVTVDNNFVYLTLGTDTSITNTVDFYYESTVTYSAGTQTGAKFVPYLMESPTSYTYTGKAKIATIEIVKDDNDIGDEKKTEKFSLAITQPTSTQISAFAQGGFRIALFSDSTLATEVTGTGLDALSYDTPYYIAVVYTQDGTKDLVSTSGSATITEPAQTVTINYSLTATAVIEDVSA